MVSVTCICMLHLYYDHAVCLFVYLSVCLFVMLVDCEYLIM